MQLHAIVIHSDVVLPDPQLVIFDLDAKIKSVALNTDIIGGVNLHGRI